MTEQELEIVCAKLKTEALTVIFLGVCNALARSFPTFGQSLLATVREKQMEYQKVVVKGFPPAMSDLIAGEFQESFDDIVKQIEKSFSK